MARLILNPKAVNRREIPLSHGALLAIGRDPSNDLVLPDAMVSRRHAVIEQRDGSFLLRDCRSANGSVVNGERVSERVLCDGDLLAIGSVRLQFREDPPLSASGKVLVHPSALALRCGVCRAIHRPGDLFCGECGAALGKGRETTPTARCAVCGSPLRRTSAFCAECGARVDGEAADQRARPPADGGVAPAPPRLAAHLSSGSMAIAPHASTDPDHRPAPRPAERAPRSIPGRSSPARPTERLLAALADGVFVASAQAAMLAPVLWYWWSRPAPSSPAEVTFAPILASAVLVPLALVCGFLYHVYGWCVRGATPGKELFGLRVELADGRSPIPLEAALLRAAGYALGGLSLGLAVLPVAFGGLALHDRVAATRVCRGGRR